MTIHWPTLVREAETILHTIVPEHAATPVRFVSDSSLPGPTCQNCNAWIHVHSDLLYRKFVPSPPPGRFLCIVCNRDYYTEEGISDEQHRRLFIAMALHEFAHALDCRMFSNHLTPHVETNVRADGDRLIVVEKPMTEMNKDEEFEFREFIYEVHNPLRFVRAACHLLFRAKQLPGLERLSPGSVICGAPYRSSPEAYYQLLGDEPARLIGKRLADILRTDPPDAFSRMAEFDDELFLAAQERRNRKGTDMGITDALAKIETKQQTAAAQERDRAQAAEAAYQKMLTRVLAGQNVDDIELEKVIAAAGRSTKEVREAIFQQQRISNLRETVAAAETVPAAMRAIAIDRKAADDKLEVARVQHAREVNAIAIRSAQCDDIIVQASNARSELRRLTGPEDHNRLAEIGREGLRLTERIRVIRELRDRNEVMHKANVETAKRNGRPLDINDEQEYARRHPHSPLAGVLDCRAELDLLSEQMNALAEERQSIERRIAS